MSRHRSPTQTSVRDGFKHTFVNLLVAAALGWIAYTGQASIGHSGPVIHLPVWIRVLLGLASLGILLHESTVVWMTRRPPPEPLTDQSASIASPPAPWGE